jgi:hypothetical protein
MKIIWVVPLRWAPLGAIRADDHLQRFQYNNPGLVVDLGIGLAPSPVPMDADGDLLADDLETNVQFCRSESE